MSENENVETGVFYTENLVPINLETASVVSLKNVIINLTANIETLQRVINFLVSNVSVNQELIDQIEKVSKENANEYYSKVNIKL
jgi:hypothetical protein